MLVRWEQRILAERSGVSLPTIGRLEAKPGPLLAERPTVAKLKRALEDAGVEFTNGGKPGVRLKGGEDRDNLDQHIDRLEGEVTHLKQQATGEPSPAKGMAMLRKAKAKNELTRARNKRSEEAE
jgi:transcriptional regulator with XRE-family HTH domain